MARGSLLSQFTVKDSADSRIWTASMSDKLLEETIAVNKLMTTGETSWLVDLGGLSGTGTRFLTIESDQALQIWNGTKSGFCLAGGGFLAAVVTALDDLNITNIGSSTATIDVRIYEFTSTG